MRNNKVDKLAQRITPLLLFLGALISTIFPSRLNAAESFCIDYQYYPQTDNFSRYDFTILSPYSRADLAIGQRVGKKFYAYISGSEVARNAQYYDAAVQAGIPFIGENPNWNSEIVDATSPLWASFIINQLAQPAVDKGYDGFFFDTMDSYYLTSTSNSAQEAGLVDMIKKVRAAFPTKKIIINRGFPMFERLKNTVDGMLIEGLYYTWPGQQQDSEDTDWLINQLNIVKAAGRSVYVVDYMPTTSTSAANDVANQILQRGYSALVVQEALNGTVLAPQPGQGQVEPDPEPQPPPPPATPKIDRLFFKNGLPSVSFIAQAGKTYTVLCSDQPAGSVWRAVGTRPAGTTTESAVISDFLATGLSKRFYRLYVQ